MRAVLWIVFLVRVDFGLPAGPGNRRFSASAWRRLGDADVSEFGTNEEMSSAVCCLRVRRFVCVFASAC